MERMGGRERVSSNGEWREYIPRDGVVVWGRRNEKRMSCVDEWMGWYRMQICIGLKKKPNATSPKSVKWFDDALQKADR